MTPEEFRRYGRQVVDWIADYMEQVEQYPVLSRVAPGEVRSKLPTSPPQVGESFEAILRDVDEIIMPGITHWQSPNFFAYFTANGSPPAVLGEMLAAGLNVQGMLWQTSPACTELETHVLDWLVDILDLPTKFKSSSTGGVPQKMTSGHKLGCPCWQGSHAPQGIAGSTVTSCPTCKSSTPAPNSAIQAENSCPIMMGAVTTKSPIRPSK